MAIFYPRKQTVFIFLVCVCVVGGLTTYINFRNTQSDSKGSQVSLSDKVLSQSATGTDMIATSSDWQKQFLAPNAQSDVKGPVKFQTTTKKTTSASTEPLSLTNQIGRSLFTQYIQAHQAGLDTDPDVISGISDRLNSQVAAAASPISYSLDEIRRTSDTSTTAIVTYAKTLMSVVKNLPAADAATLANDALTNNDTAALTKIDPVISAYKSILTSMHSMTVPNILAKDHLDLENGISIALFNAEALRSANIDPVKTLAAISIYIQGLKQISDALANLADGFANAGIIFADAATLNSL